MKLIDNKIREKIIILLEKLGFENHKFGKHTFFKLGDILIVVNRKGSFTDMNMTAIRFQLDALGLYDKNVFDKYIINECTNI